MITPGQQLEKAAPGVVRCSACCRLYAESEANCPFCAQRRRQRWQALMRQHTRGETPYFLAAGFVLMLLMLYLVL